MTHLESQWFDGPTTFCPVLPSTPDTRVRKNISLSQPKQGLIFSKHAHSVVSHCLCHWGPHPKMTTTRIMMKETYQPMLVKEHQRPPSWLDKQHLAQTLALCQHWSKPPTELFLLQTNYSKWRMSSEKTFISDSGERTQCFLHTWLHCSLIHSC